MSIEKLAFYKASWAGVLRIALWCILFLFLFGKLIPPVAEDVPLAKTVQGTPIIPMLTMISDSRSVRGDYKPDPKKVNIAWLSDSSGVMLDRGYSFQTMPEEGYRLVATQTVRRLQDAYGLKNLEVLLYLRLSSRSIDMLAFSLASLQIKPDIIVIPLNSIWSFSHYQVANRDRAMPLIATVFWHYPRLWPMLLSICPPVYYLWTFAGLHLDSIKQAHPFKKHLLKSYGPLFNNGHGKQDEIFNLNDHVSNIPFWIIMNLLGGDKRPVTNEKGDLLSGLIYHQVIRNNDPFKTNSWGAGAFRHMVDILKESGVPVLIYNWPPSETLRSDPKTLEGFNKTVAFLKQENEQLKGTNVKIIGDVPEDIRKTMRFIKSDDYHIHDEGKLDEYLAREIWLMLKEHSPKVKDKKK